MYGISIGLQLHEFARRLIETIYLAESLRSLANVQVIVEGGNRK